MRALYVPGPSYNDETAKVAGWVKILRYYHEALEELGYEVIIPEVEVDLQREPGPVKVAAYSALAAAAVQDNLPIDLYFGVPAYGLGCQLALPQSTPKVVYVWNNADPYRDRQLAPEYERFKEFGKVYETSLAMRAMNRLAIERATHVVACSPWVKKTHTELVPADKISVTFWGVDSQMFMPAAEEPPGFRVLFVGSDPIRKGLPYLWRAMQGLEGAELWLAGCDAQIAGPGVKVNNIGMVPHERMPDIMRQCHVICIPTLEDGIACSIQEGMACGLAPIATQEAAEVFEPGVSGFRVGYRDWGQIQSALQLLQASPETRQRMSRAARALAAQQSWHLMKEHLKIVLTHVARGIPTPFESPMPWLKERIHGQT